MASRWEAFAAGLVPAEPVTGRFAPRETAGLPDPVRGFFAQAIAPGTPLAPAVRLAIRGRIRLGGRWLGFRSHEVLAPRTGLVWWGRVAGVMFGGDRARGDDGCLHWKLLGCKTVARAEGPDVARSGVGRAVGEGLLWAPTAILPRAGVTWSAPAPDEIVATARTPHDEVVIRIGLDADHRPVWFVFDRWGDPDERGTPGLHPFGGTVHAWSTFAGVTVATAGEAGWFYGTDRWPDGAFCYEVTEVELCTGR